MTDIELVLNMLAEVTTTAISQKEKPFTMPKHKQVARSGGSVAKNARLDIEKHIQRKAVSPLNANNKKSTSRKFGAPREVLRKDKSGSGYACACYLLTFYYT